MESKLSVPYVYFVQMSILKYSHEVRVLVLSLEGLSLSISNDHKISFYSRKFPIYLLKIIISYIIIAFEWILIPDFILCKCLIRIRTGAFLTHPLEPILVPSRLRLTHLDPPCYPSLHRVYIR
jgi:hypothetical protein